MKESHVNELTQECVHDVNPEGNQSAFAQLQKGLQKQTIDLSVKQPHATQQLSIPNYNGMIYRQDFHTWSFFVPGGFMQLNLNLTQAIPVDLTLNICAALVQGNANCPISIRVNNQELSNSYSDHNPNFHPETWTIPMNMLNNGDNQIRIYLDHSATTQLFVNAITVEQALLNEQSIDLSGPCYRNAPQFQVQQYFGAGYRADFSTWSILRNDGYFNFHLNLSEQIPVGFSMNLCAALVNGKANCPISIWVNNQQLVNSYHDTNANFHDKSWTIPANFLNRGSNEIRVVLDQEATTQIFIRKVTVWGE